MNYVNEYLELGERLKEIRTAMGYSLEQVSSLTGVSKTMLSQIESAKSIPTIATVCKIANGLKIKVDSLLSSRKTCFDVIRIRDLTPTMDDDGRILMYCIFPFSPTSGFEVYYCVYKPGCDYTSESHVNGKSEYLTVFQGELEVVINNKSYILKTGESIEFDATAKHRYINRHNSNSISQAILSYN